MSEQPQWPSRGQKAPNYWDDDLKSYIDWLRDSIDDKIAEVIAADSTVAAAAALAVDNAAEDIYRRVDGVVKHNGVSGNLILDPADGYHVIVPSGALTIELGVPPGYSMAFKVVSDADQVEVEGLPDLELTDNAWVTFVFYDGAWDLAAAGAGGGGGAVEPVTDPPTQPGTVTVDPTVDGYNLSWVASTVAAGYEVQIDAGTWVDSGANLTHVFTGLTSGSSHSGAVRAYNSVGAKSTARAWGPASVDTMALHEMFMTYEPSIYLRATDGTVRDYSEIAGTWTVPGGWNTPTHTGPALTPGDTSSLRLQANAGLSRPSNGLPVGMTSYTAILVTQVPANAGNGFVGIKAGGNLNTQWDSPSYNLFQPGGRHVTFIQWDGTGNNATYYRDNATSTESKDVGSANPTIDDTGTIWLHGNQYGSTGLEGGWLSHVLVIPNRLLTQPERDAIALSAGTTDNPAGNPSGPTV